MHSRHGWANGRQARRGRLDPGTVPGCSMGPMMSHHLTATAIAVTLAALPMAVQNPHPGMDQRGAAVMGFDQGKTTHHFYLYDDGGAIDVAVKDQADTSNRDAIRSHL